MLARNPIPCTGNQIEIRATLICENFLNWCILRRVECYSCDMEMERFSTCINHHNTVADLHITETPEDRGIAARTIKVSIDHRTSSFTWPWA